MYTSFQLKRGYFFSCSLVLPDLDIAPVHVTHKPSLLNSVWKNEDEEKDRARYRSRRGIGIVEKKVNLNLIVKRIKYFVQILQVKN